MIEVAINVGMIKFKGGDDGVIGLIVPKLGALVEKSRVVFIAFDDKLLSLFIPCVIGKLILKNPSNQVRGLCT